MLPDLQAQLGALHRRDALRAGPLPGPVAEPGGRDEQPVGRRIIDDEGEHPFEGMYEVRSEVLVQMHEHLCVAPCREAVTAVEELLA